MKFWCRVWYSLKVKYVGWDQTLGLSGNVRVSHEFQTLLILVNDQYMNVYRLWSTCLSSEFVLLGNVNARRLEVGYDGICGLDYLREIVVGYIPCLAGFARSALKPSS